MIEIVATSIEAFSANCSKLFHSGNLVLELILENDMQDWFGFQVGCQPFSSYNFVSRGSCPPTKAFQKHRQPHQCLIWAVGQKIALRFSSVRSRLTAIFNSNLTTWGKYFGVSHTVCCGLMHSGKSHVLKYDNRLRSPEDGFQIRNNKIIIGRKAIHHHWTDQNPHQRWSLPQRKPALHHPSDRGRDPVFSRASGSAALDAICTHSVGIGFYHKFEPDLSRVWHFLRQAG